MGRSIPHLHNTLTELPKNVHESTSSNKFTYHQNVTGKGLSKITKCLKTTTSHSLLCMLVLLTTELTKIQYVNIMLIGCTHKMQ